MIDGAMVGESLQYSQTHSGRDSDSGWQASPVIS